MPNISPDVNHIENVIDKINLLDIPETDSNISNLNSLIDELNAFSYKSCLNVSNDRVDTLLRKICLSVPIENSLTVAKYCQLVLNLNSRKRLELSGDTLDAFTDRLTRVLASPADLSYLDILQLLRILISSHVDYFSKDYSKLLEVILNEIENSATLADAQAIKLYRLHCLLDLTSCLSQQDSQRLINTLLDTFYSQDPSSPILLAKVWCACLEGIGRALPKAKDVKDLAKLMGGVVAALKLGLGAPRPGGTSQRTAGLTRPDLPPSPTPVYPSPLPPVTTDTSLKRPTDTNKVAVGHTKKWKGKTKEVEWCGDETLASWPSANNNTSESEASDSEGSKRAREFAKTRYTAAYTLVQIVKVIDRKVVSGYYSLLLGPSCLQASLTSDSMLKPKLASVLATRTILLQAKPYLALAQHSEGKAFTAYCETLSELLVSLHGSIALSLTCGGGHHAVTTLLHCLATLASVSPYHRLKPNLLTKALSTIIPHLLSANAKEVVAGVRCLGTFLSLEPQTQELKDVIVTGPPGSHQPFSKTKPDSPWITSFCLLRLQECDNDAESLRVAYWQLIASLATYHFDTCVFSELAAFEELIVSDLTSSDLTPPIHVGVLQTLAIFLEQLSNKGDYSDECIALWNRLLAGPLVPFLQDTSCTASFACDCLSLINQQSFYALTEKRQIGLMTLVYGCCYHEEKSVRASAIKILGVLLNFPNMANESYLYDVIHILIRLVCDSSHYCRHRAAWAFGNLAELLRTKNQEFLDEISLIKLIDACLVLSKDHGNIKVNVVRALGSLLSLIKEKDLEDVLYREALDKSTSVLVKSTNSGIFMKVKWNACHAISLILANDCLYVHTSNWFEKLVRSVCNLLVNCSHFKVRSNACAALRSVKKRSHFGNLYEFVWQSLLDGLDNSANMPDFKEYKQQNDLLNQLCMSVCHLISLLEEKDVSGVKTLLEYREECLSRYISEFVSRAPPELASVVLLAHSNLTRLGVLRPLSTALAPAI